MELFETSFKICVNIQIFNFYGPLLSSRPRTHLRGTRVLYNVLEYLNHTTTFNEQIAEFRYHPKKKIPGYFQNIGKLLFKNYTCTCSWYMTCVLVRRMFYFFICLPGYIIISMCTRGNNKKVD